MICLRCASENADNNRFCGHCGFAITARAHTPVTPVTGPERDGGERRSVVLMFSDLADSTATSSRLDPEEWRELLADYHQAVEAAVTRFGGYVAKYLGDGVVAYFGWPIAHENDAERGARAGLLILKSVAELNRSAEDLGRPKLGVRIGIHLGEVVVSRAGEVYGEAPNVAGRVQSLARVDTVVVTESLLRSIGGRLGTADLGAHALKGLDRPVHLFQILESPPPFHLSRSKSIPGPTPFAGREESLDLLLSRWESARRGDGQIVTVVGEPGIGKSRLIAEFRTRIGKVPHLWLDSGGVEFFASTPFYPIIRLVERLVRLKVPGRSHDPLGRLEKLLAAAGLDVPATLPLVAEMLALEFEARFEPRTDQPSERRRALLGILIGWVLNVARRQPTVLVIEDLHWVDPSTLELIETSMEGIAAVPLLLVLTTRPEFLSPWPILQHHSAITLGRLSRGEVRDIVVGTSTAGALDRAAIETIVERAGGIPLFAEELSKLIETRPAGAGSHGIPETLAALLNARLDQLGAAREIAQVAAVVGNEITPRLVAAVADRTSDEIAVLLRRLVDAGILMTTSFAGAESYIFKHALIRDAAYGALLRPQRRELHGRVAAAISNIFPAFGDTHPEFVGRHLAAAGLHEPAVDAWQRAGIVASNRGAYREAEEAYQQALINLTALPESSERDALNLKLQSGLVTILQMTHGYSAPKTIEATERVRRLAGTAGDLTQSMTQAFRRWAALSSAGQYIEAWKVADQFYELAAKEGSRDSRANAHMIQMTSLYRLGDLAGAERHFEEGRPLFAEPSFVGRPGAVAQTFGNASRNAWMMGRADEARRRMAYATEMAKASKSPYDIAFTRYMAAILAVLLRDAERARRLAERSIELSEQHSFPQFAAISRIALGRALADLGSPLEGVKSIREGIAGMDNTQSRVAMTMYLTWLAEALVLGGELEMALVEIERSLEINPEELFFRPECLRVRGELRFRKGDMRSGRADILDAIATSTTSGAKCFTLRAVMSLAKFSEFTADTRAMLLDSISDLTEGSDTLDLHEANVLAGGSVLKLQK